MCKASLSYSQGKLPGSKSHETFHPIIYKKRQQIGYTVQKVASALRISTKEYVQIELCHILPCYALSKIIATFFLIEEHDVIAPALTNYINNLLKQKIRLQNIKSKWMDQKTSVYRGIVEQMILARDNPVKDQAIVDARLLALNAEIWSINLKIDLANLKISSINMQLKNPSFYN